MVTKAQTLQATFVTTETGCNIVHMGERMCGNASVYFLTAQDQIIWFCKLYRFTSKLNCNGKNARYELEIGHQNSPNSLKVQSGKFGRMQHKTNSADWDCYTTTKKKVLKSWRSAEFLHNKSCSSSVKATKRNTDLMATFSSHFSVNKSCQ